MDSELIRDALNSELASFILPFILIFAILYGLLSKVDLFKNKKIDVGISLVIGLMVSTVSFVSDCFSTIFSKVIIILVAVFVFYMLFGLFMDLEKKGKVLSLILGLIAFASIIGVIISSGEACGLNWALLLSGTGLILSIILGATILLGIIFWILREKKEIDKEKKPKEREKKKEPKEDEREEDEPEPYH